MDKAGKPKFVSTAFVQLGSQQGGTKIPTSGGKVQRNGSASHVCVTSDHHHHSYYKNSRFDADHLEAANDHSKSVDDGPGFSLSPNKHHKQLKHTEKVNLTSSTDKMKHLTFSAYDSNFTSISLKDSSQPHVKHVKHLLHTPDPERTTSSESQHSSGQLFERKSDAYSTRDTDNQPKGPAKTHLTRLGYMTGSDPKPSVHALARKFSKRAKGVKGDLDYKKPEYYSPRHKVFGLTHSTDKEFTGRPPEKEEEKKLVSGPLKLVNRKVTSFADHMDSGVNEIEEARRRLKPRVIQSDRKSEKEEERSPVITQRKQLLVNREGKAASKSSDDGEATTALLGREDNDSYKKDEMCGNAGSGTVASAEHAEDGRNGSTNSNTAKNYAKATFPSDGDSGDGNSPPKFTHPLQDAEISEHEALKLECIVTGYPKPEICWRKNNQPLKTIGTSFDGRRARLALWGVSHKDCGKYSCTATNHLGQDSTSCTVCLKGESDKSTKKQRDSIGKDIRLSAKSDSEGGCVNKKTSSVSQMMERYEENLQSIVKESFNYTNHERLQKAEPTTNEVSITMDTYAKCTPEDDGSKPGVIPEKELIKIEKQEDSTTADAETGANAQENDDIHMTENDLNSGDVQMPKTCKLIAQENMHTSVKEYSVDHIDAIYSDDTIGVPGKDNLVSPDSQHKNDIVKNQTSTCAILASDNEKLADQKYVNLEIDLYSYNESSESSTSTLKVEQVTEVDSKLVEKSDGLQETKLLESGSVTSPCSSPGGGEGSPESGFHSCDEHDELTHSPGKSVQEAQDSKSSKSDEGIPQFNFQTKEEDSEVSPDNMDPCASQESSDSVPKMNHANIDAKSTSVVSAMEPDQHLDHNTPAEVENEGHYLTRIQRRLSQKRASIKEAQSPNSRASSHTESSENTEGDQENLQGGEEAPFIEELLPEDIRVFRGSTVKLHAVYVGEPPPDVTWYKYDKPLQPDPRIYIETKDGNSSLMIKESIPEDTARYSLHLENKHGDDRLSSSVTVEDIPSPPAGSPAATGVTNTSVILSWYGPPFDGRSTVTHFQVELRQLLSEEWTVVNTCKNTSYQVTGLKPKTEYQFRVRAGNKHGLSQPGAVSATVTTVQRKDLILPGDISPSPFLSPISPGAFLTDELPFTPREVSVIPGRKFEDHFEKQEEIGKGKFGNVYTCVEKATGRTWAAKVIRCRASQRAECRRELEVMNMLHHPKLLLLWDAFESPREMVLVMDHVSGGELFERIIDDDYILTERECVHFMRQICEGVRFMHSKSVVHLDLKPENVMCITANSNEIKLIDFGLARLLDPKQETKVMFGTPEFVAPEVINYDHISFATDMWSVGVICYILLSGLSPFLGDSDSETFVKVTKADYDFDDEVFDEITADAKNFIEELLQKTKEKRKSAEECLAHKWLSQDVKVMKAKRLSTEKHKSFMARAKWQKTGNAIRALGRLSLMKKAMTGQSPTRDRRSSPSSGTRDGRGVRGRINSEKTPRQAANIDTAMEHACMVRSDSDTVAELSRPPAIDCLNSSSEQLES